MYTSTAHAAAANAAVTVTLINQIERAFGILQPLQFFSQCNGTISRKNARVRILVAYKLIRTIEFGK